MAVLGTMLAARIQRSGCTVALKFTDLDRFFCLVGTNYLCEIHLVPVRGMGGAGKGLLLLEEMSRMRQARCRDAADHGKCWLRATYELSF